ncbi:MAG: ParA family protein [Oscillospiraceae bacterium]
MSKVISIITQKGGVGKTTIVNALASVLSKRGLRILTIDMDPQGNLSYSVGAETEVSPTVYEVFTGDVDAQYAVQRCAMTDIIPSNILLSSVELEFTGYNREYLLSKAIQSIKPLYDFILIDSPPGLGILTVNALTASDYVIMPMLPDIFSLQGITMVYETVEHIQQSCNPNLKPLGILVNKFNKRSLLHREVFGTAKMISESINVPVFNTIIRNCNELSEAQSLQCDITDYAKRCRGVKDFNMLANELKDRGL